LREKKQSLKNVQVD